MVAQLPVGNVIRCVQQGVVGGVNTANVFHVYCGVSDPMTVTTVQAVSDAVRAAYVARFKSFISTQATIGALVAQDLTTDMSNGAVTSGSDAGGDSATLGPANVALCISWKIARHYRGGHPRTYLWGLTTNGPAGNANTWNTTIVNNVRTAATNFMNDVGNIAYMIPLGGSSLVCVSRYAGKDGAGHPILRNPPLVQPITGAAVDTRIDTQRRRLGKDR